MSYDSVADHRAMALDEVRNGAYQAALEEVINADSVVLDLGAGLGTLGLLAARLGARRVHLVEPSDVVSVTRQIVAANGLEGIVEVHHGRIEDVELPEPVSVITSVMTGNFLLSEDLLPTLFHARDRYLEPGGTLLPAQGCMVVQPVSLPGFYAKHIGSWQERQLDLTYEPAHAHAVNSLYWGRRALAEAVPLAPAADLFTLDFRTAESTHCDARAELVAGTVGTLHGWLGWFRMALGSRWISTGPTEPEMHWAMAFLPVAEPVEVSRGEVLSFALLRPPAGDWTWTSGIRGALQRQSTFFSNPAGLGALHAAGRDATPKRSARAEGMRAVLDAMDGSTSVGALAQVLRKAAPEDYPTAAEALRAVQTLLRRFG